jgi:ADP-heptose:LPS heptosyltransferase
MGFRQSIEEFRRTFLRGMFSALAGSANGCARLPSSGIHRVLLIRPNHRLGNTLLLTPILADIERAYPSAEVDIITSGQAAHEVFGGFDSVRHLLVLPRKIVRHPLILSRTLHHLRTQRYDLAIDPCVSSQTGRVLLLMSRAKYKLGFVGKGNAGRISCGVAIPSCTKHMAQVPVYLLRTARGEAFDIAPCPTLDIRLSETERKQGEGRRQRILGNPSPGVFRIGVFGEATGAKAFPDAWWKAMLETFEQARRDVVFIEILPATGASKFGEAFPSYYSTSIRRMAAVMAGLDLVISADCGVMHLAVASGAMTIGLFKVTDSSMYAPYGDDNFAVLVQSRSPAVVASEVIDRLGRTGAWTRGLQSPSAT